MNITFISISHKYSMWLTVDDKEKKWIINNLSHKIVIGKGVVKIVVIK